MPATLPSAPLRAATFYLGLSPRKLVYLYDAAGENYQTSDRVSTLRFLGTTAGVLLIVDPFALTPIRKRLEDDGIVLPPHSAEPPSSVAGRLTQALREQRSLSADRRIDVPVDPRIIATLEGIEDFRQAYEPDGMRVEEFDALPPRTGHRLRLGFLHGVQHRVKKVQ